MLLAPVAGCSEDRPCPPPMLVCVATQEEADERNADLDPACRIYAVCNGGLDADHFWFDWHAQAAEFDDPGGSASMQVFGIANRLYMLETGRFEPYIQGTLGWAWVTSSDKSEQCDDADGVFPELSVGFDVYAAPWLRLAPSVFVTQREDLLNGSASSAA